VKFFNYKADHIGYTVEKGYKDMKYYIRAYIGGWKEVSKEKADSFIKGILDSATMPLTEERKQEIINYHYKEENE